MKKTQQHTPEEIKKYTAAMRRFRMPALPLLTLNGAQKKPDKEINESELKKITKEVKHHE